MNCFTISILTPFHKTTEVSIWRYFDLLFQLLCRVLKFAGDFRLAEATARYAHIIIILFRCGVTNIAQILLALFLIVSLLSDGSGRAAFNAGFTVNPYVEQAV